MDDLFILDSNCIICRFFFALKNKEKNVFDSFLEFLNNIIKKNTKSKIILIFDKAKKNFRKNIFVDYKKNRIPNIELYQEINKIIEFCIYQNIPIDYSETLEADDIIAGYTYHYKNKYKIYIVSNDKDLMQLVDNNVVFFNPFEKKILNSLDVFNKIGVYPKDLALFLALSGDSSDNIPGIIGIGPKKAIDIINNNKIYKFKISDLIILEKMLSLTTLKPNKEFKYKID